jgi:hypothetical protein
VRRWRAQNYTCVIRTPFYRQLLVRAHLTAQGSGEALDTERVYAFGFVEGKVANGQVFVSDPAQFDVFWDEAWSRQLLMIVRRPSPPRGYCVAVTTPPSGPSM